MTKSRWVWGILGLLLLAVSLYAIWLASSGLAIVKLTTGDPPITLITPASTESSSRPVVLIGHGFAGSAVIMRGFAYTLAHAGYDTVLWDFSGHGANSHPFQNDPLSHSLIADPEAALAAVSAYRGSEPEKFAILGHSMGSGVAIDYGQTHPETSATVAISPVNRTVTPALPRNLLLVAGEREASFLHNARSLLTQAGGSSGEHTAGTARALVVIPQVEHVSILFAPAAHQATRAWLDNTFGVQPGSKTYTDLRILWYLTGIIGFMIAFIAFAPRSLADKTQAAQTRPLILRLAALVAGLLGASLLLWLLNLAGLDLSGIFGLAVGGYLLVWFGLAGLASLFLLRTRLSLPGRNDILAGLLVTGALWLGVGLLGQLVWLQWTLVPARLILWPLGGLLLLPWFLAFGQAALPSSNAGWFGWWLLHCALLVTSWLLLIRLNPGLSFLWLLLPLVPAILGLHALAAIPYRNRWPVALSGALFVSWVILAVFPLN